MPRHLVIALVAVFSVLSVACGDADSDSDAVASTTTAATTTAPTTTPTTTAEAVTTTAPVEEDTAVSVQLVSYPFWPNEVAVESQAALDELAGPYSAGIEAGEEPQMERFLFGSLPVSVFDEVFEGTTPERRQELMWLMHLSGYFGVAGCAVRLQAPSPTRRSSDSRIRRPRRRSRPRWIERRRA